MDPGAPSASSGTSRSNKSSNLEIPLTRIVGVDCAGFSHPKAVGLAVAELTGTTCLIRCVEQGKTWPGIVEFLKESFQDDVPTLLAVDAPLGWPTAMGLALVAHRAGGGIGLVRPMFFERDYGEIQTELGEFFSREGDRIIAGLIEGCCPLDVGANRIARVTYTTLKLLEAVRSPKRPLPLAWVPGSLSDSRVIEVYPAATLMAYGESADGYKKKGQTGLARREQIVSFLAGELNDDTALIRGASRTSDLVDAMICILAGRDFLVNEMVEPRDQETARREGFIWVRQPIEASRAGERQHWQARNPGE